MERKGYSYWLKISRYVVWTVLAALADSWQGIRHLQLCWQFFEARVEHNAVRKPAPAMAGDHPAFPEAHRRTLRKRNPKTIFKKQGSTFLPYVLHAFFWARSSLHLSESRQFTSLVEWKHNESMDSYVKKFRQNEQFGFYVVAIKAKKKFDNLLRLVLNCLLWSGWNSQLFMDCFLS